MKSDPKKEFKDYLKGEKPLEYAILPFDNEDSTLFDNIKKMKDTITPKKKKTS